MVGVASDAAQLRLNAEQSIPIQYNQGIARVDGGWILSGTDSPLPNTDVLVRTDEQFRIVATNGPAIPPAWRARGYDHIGDIDVVGGVVYAPFEQPDYSKGQQATARFDAGDLRFLDAVVLPQHENSFVAVDPNTMVAYSMDHFDGDALLRYDVARGWVAMAPLRLSRLLQHTQGASISDGVIWISTSDDHNGIYRVDLADGQVVAAGQHAHPGGEGEGIDASPLPSGSLHALVIDPSQTTVWVEHFALGRRGHGGVLNVAAAAALAAVATAALGVVIGMVRRRRRGPPEGGSAGLREKS